jgi:GTPase SAR1 family protein
MNQEYDFLAKLFLLGDSKVGKTNVMNRFTDDVF